MALGDKEYNYNYYNLPVDRKWSNGIGEIPFAALVRPNIWGYWPSGIYYDDGMYSNSDKNGKPLDDTIAIWRLPRNASYGCNAFFTVDTSATLGAHYDVNINDYDVPLAVAAVDVTSNNWGKFDKKCVERYAFDIVMTCNGPRSVLAYDINPLSVCLRGAVLFLRRSTNAITGGDISTIASTANNTDYDVCVIRPTMYRGPNNSRINTAVTIPDDYAPYFDGVLLADSLSNIPIPAGQTYLKSLIADTANGHNYRNDVIYRPFVTRYGSNVYSGANDNTVTSQMEIGFQRQYTVNQLISGAATISGANRITGQIYRCNYDPKYFDDVAYVWENVIFDTVSKVDIQNGFNLNSFGDDRNIRFYTRIRIIDYKGNSRGKAIELAVKHELAYIGFYFADTQTRAESAVLGAEGDGVGVYLPEKIGGVTTGRYFTGDEIKDVPYADADSVDVFRYEPPPTGDTGDFSTVINTGTIGSGAKYYACSNAQMNALSTWLNTTYVPTDEDTFVQDFKGMNPADYITTVMYYPFDIPLESGTDEQIVVGKLNATGATGRVLKYKYGEEYNFGSYTIPEQGNFMDYMRKITVFVPFCGSIELDPLIWTGCKLTVKMQIDFPTGACTAYLYRGSDRGDGVFATLSGTVGVPLPLSAVANGSYQVAITNLLASHKAAHRALVTGALGVAGGALTAVGGAMAGNLKIAGGGALSAVSGITAIDASADKMENIDYNIDHTVASINDVSGGSPFLNCGADYRVKILILTPVLSSEYDAASFGRTTGFACCRQGVLSEISHGFTQCASADLSGIACTATEKNMIFNALQSGVYV